MIEIRQHEVDIHSSVVSEPCATPLNSGIRPARVHLNRRSGGLRAALRPRMNLVSLPGKAYVSE